jgi:hypothetical protein
MPPCVQAEPVATQPPHTPEEHVRPEQHSEALAHATPLPLHAGWQVPLLQAFGEQHSISALQAAPVLELQHTNAV